MYQLFFKRVIDICIAFVTLIILSPVLIVITLLLKYVNKGEAFFFQERPGKDEKPIYIVKFKSMTDAKDQAGNLLLDNLRLTRLGAFIRKYSLEDRKSVV